MNVLWFSRCMWICENELMSTIPCIPWHSVSVFVQARVSIEEWWYPSTIWVSVMGPSITKRRVAESTVNMGISQLGMNVRTVHEIVKIQESMASLTCITSPSSFGPYVQMRPTTTFGLVVLRVVGGCSLKDRGPYVSRYRSNAGPPTLQRFRLQTP